MIKQLVFVLIVACGGSAYKWEAFDGNNFPTYEYPFTHFGVNWHYCRASDTSSNVYTGAVNERDKQCVIALVGESNVRTFSQFDIFVIDDNTEVAHFGANFTRGIDCTDAQAPDCKLGMSVYAQNTCFRNLAKISVNNAYLVDGTNQYLECPFATYLYIDPK